ncbi:succinate--CoA ligase subunit alpha [Candidatus Aerophobetes bacterium]|uniref:Succinate--CoA ligase [ADP-forming] subunit alpha n=1 Tax=Aerophobetes bacterium TaxID=2030807 RepID=A0A523VXJ2_UNCAE|nr:MAG: succinate--CoA ligase subunit alpha [Candidatus Aerophobetes bacterium]
MSILVCSDTRVVVQGITGREGSFHAARMKEYGTKIVAGVTPGREGERVDGIPVYNTVKKARQESAANTSVIYVPHQFAPDAILEAADAGVELIVCITEGISTLDMIKVCCYVSIRGSRLIGPNSPGVISPGKTKVGIMPGAIHKQGSVGVVSRSGTLTYEVVQNLSMSDLGQSTCVGIGGDSIIGSSFVDILSLFEEDSETQAIVLIGEIGGRDEEEAAVFIREKVTKPVVALVAGRCAPREKRMGHAGAIISGGEGTADDKIKAFEEASIPVAESPGNVVQILRTELEQEGDRQNL